MNIYVLYKLKNMMKMCHEKKKLISISILVFLFLSIDVAFASYYTPAIILGHRLRIRSEPNLNARVIEHLDKGQLVVAIGKTTHSVTIDGLSAPWYYIITSSGTIGWSFGGYINFEFKQNCPISLNFEQDTLPSANGLSYIHSTTAEEGSVFSVNSGILLMNTLDLDGSYWYSSTGIDWGQTLITEFTIVW